jgi:hypothetical protein
MGKAHTPACVHMHARTRMQSGRQKYKDTLLVEITRSVSIIFLTTYTKTMIYIYIYEYIERERERERE